MITSIRYFSIYFIFLIALSSQSYSQTLIRSSDSYVSSNSTTTVLNSNATFTGTWTSTLGYASIATMIYSNVASATNGLKFQFSSDGTNIDYVSNWTYDSSHITSNIAHAQTVPTRGRYARILYTNGTSTQSTFRLSTVFKVGNSSPAIMDVDNTVLDHHQAALNKAVIVGKTTAGSGSWVDVKVNPSGALSVDATDSLITTTVSFVKGGSTATPANIVTSTTSTTLLSANTAHRGRVIMNDTTGAYLYVKYGTTASSTSWTFKLAPQESLILNTGDYNGRIDGILSTGTGTAVVTEVTY